MNFETKVQPTLKIQATGWYENWDDLHLTDKRVIIEKYMDPFWNFIKKEGMAERRHFCKWIKERMYDKRCSFENEKIG